MLGYLCIPVMHFKSKKDKHLFLIMYFSGMDGYKSHNWFQRWDTYITCYVLILIEYYFVIFHLAIMNKSMKMQFF